jgi:hypothetical protein
MLTQVMTHMFVHRNHYTVFGSLYPKELSNTEHDEWISHVYGYKNTFLHTAVQVCDYRPLPRPPHWIRLQRTARC